MKHVKLTVAMFLASWFLLVQTGCFGRFALVRKVYEFNDDIAGDDLGGRFIKNLVYWVFNIIPVYGIAGFLDGIIFNLIEFWTGSNPLAMVEGQQEIQLVRKGNDLFKMTASKNTMHVKQLKGANAGQEVTFVWQPNENTWYMIQNDEYTKLADIQIGILETTAHVYLPNGMALTKKIDG